MDQIKAMLGLTRRAPAHVVAFQDAKRRLNRKIDQAKAGDDLLGELVIGLRDTSSRRAKAARSRAKA